jgi:hypothetical protein
VWRASRRGSGEERIDSAVPAVRSRVHRSTLGARALPDRLASSRASSIAKQLEALTQPGASHRWLFWGNQVGKTTLGAVDIVLSALGRHPLQLVGLPRCRRVTALGLGADVGAVGEDSAAGAPDVDPEVAGSCDAPPPFAKPVDEARHRHPAPTTARSRASPARRGAGRRALPVGALHQASGSTRSIPKRVWDEMQPRLLRYGGTALATMTPLKGLTYVHGRVYEPVTRWSSRIPNPREHWYSHAGLRRQPGDHAEALDEMLRHELRRTIRRSWRRVSTGSSSVPRARCCRGTRRSTSSTSRRAA